MKDNFVSRQTIGMGTMTEKEIERLHAASLQVLENVGVQFWDNEAQEVLKKHGAKVDGRLVKIPPKMVEEALKTAPSKVTLYDRNGNQAMSLEKGMIYFGTGSDTPYVQDWRTDQVRRNVLNDTAEAALVSDALPNIDFIMSMGLASDAPVPVSDIYQHVAMLKNSIKPQAITAHDDINTKTIIEIDESATGYSVKDRPHIVMYNEPSAPLRHMEEVCRKALICADTCLPIIYAPGVVMSGSGPVTLAGSLTISNSEFLSGLVLHQCRRPGAPIIMGGNVLALDQRSGMVCYCAPETHLNYVYVCDMARYYDVPVFTLGGSSDCLTFDQQTAAEAMMSLLVNAVSGSNLIHDVGFMGQGLIASIDCIVACNEMIGLVKRIVRGVDFSEEKFDLEEIAKVGPGGNFFMEESTVEYFREELWLPELIDRENIHKRMASSEGRFTDNIKKKINKIFAEYKPQALPAEVEQRIDQIVQNAEKEKM